MGFSGDCDVDKYNLIVCFSFQAFRDERAQISASFQEQNCSCKYIFGSFGSQKNVCFAMRFRWMSGCMFDLCVQLAAHDMVPLHPWVGNWVKQAILAWGVCSNMAMVCTYSCFLNENKYIFRTMSINRNSTNNNHEDCPCHHSACDCAGCQCCHRGKQRGGVYQWICSPFFCMASGGGNCTRHVPSSCQPTRVHLNSPMKHTE